MLTNEQVAQFQRDGFLLGPRVLGDAQIETLRDELKRVIENHDTLERKPVRLSNLSGRADAPVWQIVNIWEASEPFHELIAQPTIVGEIAQLTGARELRIWHDQIQYKPATTGGVNMWHQDAPLWPVLAPMTEVSAWVALDDVDEENGCMWMVPGSHRWGNQIAYLQTLPDFGAMPGEWAGHALRKVSRPVRAGQVHYHHALTWHGSPANQSDRPRRAIALHYMTQETRHVASGEHIMQPFIAAKDGEKVEGEHFPQVWPAAH
jgi:hypothetical protein